MKEIAVILATYNGEMYIKQQLDSLIGQTYQNFVCYIHDDGSTDNTLEICTNYANRFPDKIKILHYGKCGGAKENFFSMIPYVKESYLMFCDQDDFWHENKIESSILSIKKLEALNPDKVVLCFSDLRIVDEKLNVISDSYFKLTGKNPNALSFNNLLIQGFVPGCTFIMNKQLYSRLNDYENSANIYMHDWWAICLALALDGVVSYIPCATIDYRQHSHNTLGIHRATVLTALKHVVMDIFRGEMRKNKRAWIWRSRYIATQLLYVSGINDSCRTLCSRLAVIDKENRFKRIHFYLKNFREYHGLPYMLLWV